MLPILLEAAVRSLFFAAIVWLVLKALRIANPYVLMAVWQIVLGSSLIMPFFVDWMTLRVPAAGLPIDEIHRIHRVLAPDPPLMLSPTPGADSFVAIPAAFDWRFLGLLIYLAVTALLALRLIVGLALTWKLCRSASRVHEPWTEGCDVRVSAAINAPATFGSIILLPAGYAGWDATLRRAVMAHECWHVSHGDFYLLLIAAVHRAVFWFSPLGWWLSRKIAFLAETRSDVAAVRDIEDRVRYAEILLGFGSKPHRAAMALPMAGTATVAGRVECILAQTNPPRTIGWKVRLAAIACIAPLAALTAAAVAQVPPPPQVKTVSPFDPETVAIRLREQKQLRQQVPIDPALLDNYVGFYQLDQFSVFTVKRLGNQLFVQLTGQETFEIYPESAQKFFYKVVHAQISFVTDAHGRATELMLHQSGVERPANRIDTTQAQAVQDALAQRVKDGTPLAGSQAALRHQIGALLHGHINSREMTDELAAITRPQMPSIEHHFGLLGSLQAVSFSGVSIRGWDIYQCRFANGTSICRIMLAPDGKVSGLIFQWGP